MGIRALIFREKSDKRPSYWFLWL